MLVSNISIGHGDLMTAENIVPGPSERDTV